MNINFIAGSDNGLSIRITEILVSGKKRKIGPQHLKDYNKYFIGIITKKKIRVMNIKISHEISIIQFFHHSRETCAVGTAKNVIRMKGY